MEVALVRQNFNGIRSPLFLLLIIFNFGCILEHFRTSSSLVILFSKIFLEKSTWLVKLRGCLSPFVLPRKRALNTPFVHFSWNPTLSGNKRKSIHIFVSSHMTHFQWPPMALENIPWRYELVPRKISKACIYNFNFSCFWDNFLLLRAGS